MHICTPFLKYSEIASATTMRIRSGAVDISQIFTNTLPLSSQISATSSIADSGSSSKIAQTNNTSFSTVLQNLQDAGSLTSSNVAMLQALQKSTGNNSITPALVQSLETMTSANNDLAMLQALQPGSGNGVAQMLQSIYTVNSQSDTSSLASVLENGGSARDLTSATEDATLDSLLQPQTDESSGSTDDMYQTLMQISTPPDTAAVLQNLESSDSSAAA